MFKKKNKNIALCYIIANNVKGIILIIRIICFNHNCVRLLKEAVEVTDCIANLADNCAWGAHLGPNHGWHMWVPDDWPVLGPCSA